MSIPDVINHLAGLDVQEQVRKWPVVLFKPTDEPFPEPLEVDLLWAWRSSLSAPAAAAYAYRRVNPRKYKPEGCKLI
ncbi:MAG: hypothetical protein SVR81_04820 [Chloroflexota bacterium]|nr:hypothetical protein [Chloroflexota bacterium]